MRYGFAALLCAASAGAQQPASNPPAQPASVVGIVVDSLDGGPLGGAIVLVAGTDRQTSSDSTGRFHIDSIPPGDHVIGVFHPLLDSLNLSLSSKNITFTAGVATAIVVAVPSAASAIALYCSEADRKLGPAAVIGRVLAPDSDDPIPDATVRYTSVTFELSKEAGLKRNTFTREAKVRPTGEFALCGLPLNRGGTVRAARGETVTGEMVTDVTRRLLAIATLRLDTLKRGTAVVVGKVVDQKGAPVPHVDITLAGSNLKTATVDSGTFALRDLPSGSQTIQIRKVGFEATDTAVVLSSKSPTQLAVTLRVAPARLSTVNVEAARLAALERVGFERRRKTGVGHYLTGEQIQSRGAQTFSELARTILGLTVRYTRSGQAVVRSSRGVNGLNGRPGCVQYSIDGFPYQDIPAGSIDTYVRPEQMIGIEVYQPEEIPADIITGTPTQSCTLVVIWTQATSIQ